MSFTHEPVIGHWYETTESLSFKVTNVDHDGESIEIQYLDGAHAIIGFDTWNTWEVESIVPPRDWEGLCDDEESPENDYLNDEARNDASWGENDEYVNEDSEIKEY
jgi:hypothetical protein